MRGAIFKIPPYFLGEVVFLIYICTMYTIIGKLRKTTRVKNMYCFMRGGDSIITSSRIVVFNACNTEELSRYFTDLLDLSKFKWIKIKTKV